MVRSAPHRRARSSISVLVAVGLLGGAGWLLGVRAGISDQDVIDLAPTGVPPEQLPAELVACRERVYSGEMVALALGIMADHWAVTAGGDDLRDATDPTFTDLTSAAALTLPLARQDVERLDLARVGYDGLQGSCEELNEAAVGSRGDEAAACIARALAVRDVVLAGEDVDRDWREHIALMERATDADADAYVGDWREQTAAARESLDPYDAAVAELDDTPRCMLA